MSAAFSVLRRTLSAFPVLSLLVILSATAASAQRSDRAQAERVDRDRVQMDPAERVERILAGFADRLGVSDEQAERLRPILLEEAEQRRELQKQFGREDREAARASLVALQAETNKRVGEVLTEEQMPRYLEWRTSHQRGSRGERDSNRPRGSRGERGGSRPRGGDSG